MNNKKTLLSALSLLSILALIYPLNSYFGLLFENLLVVVVFFISIVVLAMGIVVFNRHYLDMSLSAGLATYYAFIIISFISLSIIFFYHLYYVSNVIMVFGLAIPVIYFVTLILNYIHERIKKIGGAIKFRLFLVSTLPIIIILFPYLSLASLFNIDIEKMKILLSIGLAISYFNLGATIFSGGTTLDLGVTLPDGERLFGEGKSIRGTISGLLISLAISVIAIGNIMPGLIIGPSTMAGDMIASFIKRRFHIARGEQVIFLDQLDSIFILLVFENIFQFIGLTSELKIILVIATFLVQIYGNVLLFLFGKKNVRW
jgi:CDP-2,3-bis-(O-geranylgeranyl)-sn-glycerol synthase